MIDLPFEFRELLSGGLARAEFRAGGQWRFGTPPEIPGNQAGQQQTNHGHDQRGGVGRGEVLFRRENRANVRRARRSGRRWRGSGSEQGGRQNTKCQVPEFGQPAACGPVHAQPTKPGPTANLD